MSYIEVNDMGLPPTAFLFLPEPMMLSCTLPKSSTYRRDCVVPQITTTDLVLPMPHLSFTAPDSRIFDLDVEGTAIVDIDLVKLGGGVATKAIKQRRTVTCTDGLLSIRLIPSIPAVDNPKLSGIEVLVAAPRPPTRAPVQAPVKPFRPILINCGGGLYIDTIRRQWLADTFFTGSAGAVTTALEIEGTDDDELYNSYRYGEMTYSIPVTSGLYEVVLHFAET
jgi:Malectin domain